MAGGILPSSSRRRRLRSGAASPRPYLQMVIGTDSMLAVLMTAGLMLSDPVLAHNRAIQDRTGFRLTSCLN